MKKSLNIVVISIILKLLGVGKTITANWGKRFVNRVLLFCDFDVKSLPTENGNISFYFWIFLVLTFLVINFICCSHSRI